MKFDEKDTVGTEVSEIKPQDHRNMQDNAWKIYAEEQFELTFFSPQNSSASTTLTILNVSPITEQTVQL